MRWVDMHVSDVPEGRLFKPAPRLWACESGHLMWRRGRVVDVISLGHQRQCRSAIHIISRRSLRAVRGNLVLMLDDPLLQELLLDMRPYDHETV